MAPLPSPSAIFGLALSLTWAVTCALRVPSTTSRRALADQATSCILYLGRLTDNNTNGLSTCAGKDPSPDACCSALRGVQYSLANQDPHSYLAVITNANLNAPCRKEMKEFLRKHQNVTVDVVKMCNQPKHSNWWLLPLVNSDEHSNTCPTKLLQDVQAKVSLKSLAKYCSDQSMACTSCPKALNNAAAKLVSNTTTKGSAKASDTAQESSPIATSPSAKVLSDCKDIAFLRLAQTEEGTVAPTLVTMKLGCYEALN